MIDGRLRDLEDAFKIRHVRCELVSKVSRLTVNGLLRVLAGE
jgi:hypothetical protein